jgi:hypothetical protein
MSGQFSCDSDFQVNRRGLFTCHKSATWDRQLYFPSEGRHAVDFFARKIQWLRPDSNPGSWVPEASMLTARPSKPLMYVLQADKWCMCGQSVSSVMVSDQWYELWEIHNNDHKNIWQVCINVNICQTNHLQKQCNYLALASLYHARLLEHLSKTPIIGM